MIILWLSIDMLSNPSTTALVGNRCAIPQAKRKNAAINDEVKYRIDDEIIHWTIIYNIKKINLSKMIDSFKIIKLRYIIKSVYTVHYIKTAG